MTWDTFGIENGAASFEEMGLGSGDIGPDHRRRLRWLLPADAGTDQDRYRAGQDIRVMATLTYLGPADAIAARGSSNPGPM